MNTTILAVLGFELAEEIEDEVRRARRKFPNNTLLTVALTEEVGELAKALLQQRDEREIRKEAIQVIAVAVRIIQEGDRTLQNLPASASKR